jgi:hypothetical protein
VGLFGFDPDHSGFCVAHRFVTEADRRGVRAGYSACLYELPPDVNVVFFGKETNVDAPWSQIEAYRSIWLVLSPDGPTEELRRRLLDRVRQAGSHAEVWQDGLARRLVRNL